MSSLATLRDAIRVTGEIPRTLEDYRDCTDRELTDRVRLAAELRKLADAHAVLATGEISRRSTHELGGAGLARQAGHRTVEELLKATAGLSGRDAVALTRVGRMTQGATPGLNVVGTAVTEGAVSTAAADAIRAGLGDVTREIPAEVLERAAEQLCVEAGTLDPDRLLKRARDLRDELDEDGITDREAAMRAQRSARLIRFPDGMAKLTWTMDPITASVVTQVYDRITSPRRGGPRFVDTERAAFAESVKDDERTTEQLASDAFLHLLRHGAAVDDTVMLKGPTPTVKVLVSATDYDTGTGHGVIEGSNEAVSIGTVKWLACTNGVTPYLVDSVGQILDQGRDKRFFTTAQKEALAARDGGCLKTHCDRPPSWTEAHHIDEVLKHHGRTDLKKGVLLCTHHHLQLHNEDCRIVYRRGQYWWEHPPDTGKPPEPLTTKSRAIQELTRKKTG